MTIRLFEPLQLRGMTLSNRIVVEPMTQFSAPDGTAGDWHFVHLGQFANCGAAMVLSESTYIDADARNSPLCLSLYSDRQESAVGKIAEFFHTHGTAKFGCQLCHGGRKASSRLPWEGGGPLPVEEGGYQAVAPSALAVRNHWPAPKALELSEIKDIVDMFAHSAEQAVRAGLDVIELHGAHGYLIHSFLSPFTNRRNDCYGGSLQNRMRFALEVFEAVRAVWPDDKPIGYRVSATDWIDGGWTVEETVSFARQLDTMGCDFIDVSSGGLDPQQDIETGPAYQTAFAAAVKAAVQMKVVAVGQITSPQQAESILRTGMADLIGVARIMLYNPRWPWHAAHELGVDTHYPHQYERANPKRWSVSAVSSPGNELKS
jgi:2,4-dienoyl-CoA reductase-like NADH-dependent reductase (Old Yellow Enzyme family)